MYSRLQLSAPCRHYAGLNCPLMPLNSMIFTGKQPVLPKTNINCLVKFTKVMPNCTQQRHRCFIRAPLRSISDELETVAPHPIKAYPFSTPELHWGPREFWIRSFRTRKKRGQLCCCASLKKNNVRYLIACFEHVAFSSWPVCDAVALTARIMQPFQ